MSRVDGMVKLMTNDKYTAPQFLESADEILSQNESVTYRSGFESKEYRYIHSGYIKNKPMFVGAYVLKNAENPRFLPNDTEFYLGFIKLVRNSGLPLDTLKRNLPYYAYWYTLDYFKADKQRFPKFQEFFKKLFTSFQFRDKELTEDEKSTISRDYIYALLLPKNASLNNGKPCVYDVDQRKFKNMYKYAMCVEINSVLNNLLALVGYDTLTVAGSVQSEGNNALHCYNLLRESKENPYFVIDCAMLVPESIPQIGNPYDGYSADVTNEKQKKLVYAMPSFNGATSDTPNVYQLPGGGRRYNFRGL